MFIDLKLIFFVLGAIDGVYYRKIFWEQYLKKIADNILAHFD